MALHNYIRMHDKRDRYFQEIEDNLNIFVYEEHQLEDNVEEDEASLSQEVVEELEAPVKIQCWPNPRTPGRAELTPSMPLFCGFVGLSRLVSSYLPLVSEPSSPPLRKFFLCSSPLLAVRSKETQHCRWITKTASGRRPNIALQCRLLIFVEDSSPFHSEALYMTSKLDRRHGTLVEANSVKCQPTKSVESIVHRSGAFFARKYGLEAETNKNSDISTSLKGGCNLFGKISLCVYPDWLKDD
ncbi:hypothetical protein L484_013020 [Morus notabilis]|uniref:Uncharacterized protein n=1 Tax=Morus notabilis TaxID=981085 RepID=W9S643_9ROSA|nr:hypothetical protein L484_013020 [Morus notabilis]